MQHFAWLNFVPTALLPWLFVGFCLATAFQLLFYVLVIFQGREKLFQKNGQIVLAPTPESFAFPPVSILVCARNEAENLKKYLPLLLTQRYAGNWELILVDDASEDNSATVLNDLQSRFNHLRVLRVEQKHAPGKKFALQYGIERARFSQLVFTDADCAPSSQDWLTEMVRSLNSRPETDIVLGLAPTLPRAGLLGHWSAFETAHTALLYTGCAAAGIPYMGVGRNMAWKKPVFERSGGFSKHAHLSSGDDDLLVNGQADAQNTAVCMSPQAFMYSEGPADWGTWFRQKRRQLSASGQYRFLHKMMLGAQAGSQVFHYFFAFLLCISGYFPVLVLGAYLIRLYTLRLIYKPFFKHIQAAYLLPMLPVTDFLQACYNGLLVPYTLLQKNNITYWK